MPRCDVLSVFCLFPAGPYVLDIYKPRQVYSPARPTLEPSAFRGEYLAQVSVTPWQAPVLGKDTQMLPATSSTRTLNPRLLS